jgi:hypothetical protein
MNIELKTYHKITNANTGKLVADRLTKKELDTFFRCPSYHVETYYRNRIWKWIDSMQMIFVMCSLSFLLGLLVYEILSDLI